MYTSVFKHKHSQWKSLGKKYGYPDCCINAFCRTAGLMLRSEHYKRMYMKSYLDRSGFIPCGRCLRLGKSGTSALVNKINIKRTVIVKFSVKMHKTKRISYRLKGMEHKIKPVIKL